jgi:hypothetical protein
MYKSSSCCCCHCCCQECLELFLEVLPAYYPDLYRLEGQGQGRTITITFPDGAAKQYALADFADRPLELCGRLVQVSWLRLGWQSRAEPAGSDCHVT